MSNWSRSGSPYWRDVSSSKTRKRLGDAYLGDGGSEDDYLVELAHPFHKGIDTRALDDVHVVILSFDFYRDGEICLVQNLELLALESTDGPRCRTLKLL